MVIPVGAKMAPQQFIEVNKINGKITEKVICGVRYVPLTDLKKQIY